MSDNKERSFGGKMLDAATGGLAGVVGGIFGLATQKGQDRRQIRQQEKLNRMQIQGQKELADYQRSLQMQMWKDTNYQPQVEELKKAGLNPGLLYGMGGAGGATVGGGIPSTGGGQAAGHSGEIQAMMGMGLQAGMMKAQMDLIKAQTEKTKAEAEKTAGVDTKNVLADTENKILQSVILDYMGQDAKEKFEMVTSPNRAIEADTYQTELEARKGIAGTIYEMWAEGKLKDKSLAEVEQLLLQNAKTREETREIYKKIELLEENIKGAKIDNVINDLEMKLQTETGIDRNSPAWMKVLGRLFVTLFSHKQ